MHLQGAADKGVFHAYRPQGGLSQKTAVSTTTDRRVIFNLRLYAQRSTHSSCVCP